VSNLLKTRKSNSTKWALVAEIVGWFLAMDALALWIFITPNSMVLQIALRGTLLGFVSLALILRLAKKNLPKALPALLMLLALAIQTQVVCLKTGESTDLLAAIFLGISFLYRGSSRLWWRFFVPVGGALLFIPIGVIETRGPALATLLKAALTPCLSFLVGALLAPFVENNNRSRLIRQDLKRIARKNSEIIEQVKALDEDVKELAGRAASPPMVTEEFLANNSLRASALIQTLTYSEIHQVVKTVIEELRDKHASWKTLRLVLTSAVDLSFPLAVRSDRESVETIARSLLENSLEALGGGEGVVRVTLKPSMTFVNFIVEDNGRGLGESSKGATKALTLLEVRERSSSMGWQIDIQARLGVGTRVSLELPRVDGDARIARSSSTRANQSRAASRPRDFSIQDESTNSRPL
jgi:signal transduction histidine kinase